MSISEDYDETIQNLSDLIDQEMGKHYDENFVAGLERSKEIIKEYFEFIE